MCIYIYIWLERPQWFDSGAGQPGLLVSHDSLYLTDIPVDGTEAALGDDEDETDAITDSPPAVNTQTPSAALTSSGKFGSSMTNEKSPSSPRILAPAHDSNDVVDDDAYYDDKFIEASHEKSGGRAAETQHNQPKSGAAQIRPRYQAAYADVSDMTLSAQTRMPHIKPAARSQSTMRRNVDAQAHSSGQTEPVRARLTPDAGGVRWVKVGQRDDDEGVSIETTTKSSVTLPVIQPKLHRKSKGDVSFLTIRKHYILHKESLFIGLLFFYCNLIFHEN